MAFCKQQHLKSRAYRQGFAKKIRPERSEGGDFFSANPQGPGLGGMSRLIRNLLRKSHWRMGASVKGIIGSYEVAGKKSGRFGQGDSEAQTARYFKMQ